jgi:hypothetical protein
VRLTPPRASVYGPESKYQRNKRRNEWKGEINRAEGHMHWAAYLAAETMSGMSYLLTDDDKGKPDWNMYWALRIAVQHQPNHAQARCKVAAFEAFVRSFRTTSRHVPLSMTADTFLDKCLNLAQLLIEGLNEGKLRTLLQAMGAPAKDIKGLGTLELLDRIVCMAAR